MSFSFGNNLLNDAKSKNLETVLEEAIKEATNDETYRKVKRMSYSGNTTDEVSIGVFMPK